MTSAVSLRLDDALRSALGPQVADILEDPQTTDLMRNADGRLFQDRLGSGRADTGHRMSNADTMAALSLLADFCGEPLTRHSPILSTTLPKTGERIAGTIPPVTSAATFAIRKPPQKAFDISAFAPAREDAVNRDLPSTAITSELNRLQESVRRKRNILICGSTGSGKTSLASCLLNFSSVTNDRVLILEDTVELQCNADDQVRFLTSQHVDMHALVRLSLRYRPDRIILGELRDGKTAMAYLGALNTGHGGGICTIHANSANDAIMRVESLCGEVCVNIPTRQIRSAIDVVVFVQRTSIGRSIKEVIYTDDIT